MARPSFFTELRFIEKRVLRKEVSVRGKEVFETLVTFVESSCFTDSKGYRFICKNWQLSYGDMEKLWTDEGNKHKSQECFRVQSSCISKLLYSLFPRFNRETFIYDEEDGYREIEMVVSIVKQSPVYLQGMFISEVNEYSETLSYGSDIKALDCLETVRKMKPLLRSGINHYLDELDPHKVKYILSVLQRPLFSSTECNTEKLALLRALWESDVKLEQGEHNREVVVREVKVEVPEKTPYNLSITKKMANLVTAHASATMTIDETKAFLKMSEAEHDARKKKLVKILRLFTEDGLEQLLSKFYPIEISEVLNGMYPVEGGEQVYKFRK